jgi:hypothetical protein
MQVVVELLHLLVPPLLPHVEVVDGALRTVLVDFGGEELKLRRGTPVA